MSLTSYKKQFDNAYQEIFQKVCVSKVIMNTRFEPVLKYGASVERVSYDISNVLVRTVTRGSASTIDTITDSGELLTINLEKEAVFHISDGEVKQAGPLNPGEVIGGQVAVKMAVDLDGRCFAEVVNANQTFDNGDLTTLVSTAVGITLNSTTVPQLVTRAPAKLRKTNNQNVLSGMCMVVDSYAAADIAQFLLGKNIDLAGAVFKNGYTEAVSNAEMYISENLTGTAVLGLATNPTANDTVVIGGVTFTFVSPIGVAAGNVLIGASVDATRANLTTLINAPGTTTATGVAVSAANIVVLQNTLKIAATNNDTTNKMTIVGTGSGRLVLSETFTDATDAWDKNYINAYFGKKGAIDLVVQDLKEVDMRETSDRRGTNVFSSYLAGIKTFTDGSKKFLNMWINA
jgi:hypothetical protein